jgi:hypothetical protein
MSKLFNLCLLFLSLVLSFSLVNPLTASAQSSLGSYKFVVPDFYSAPSYGNFCVVGHSENRNLNGVEHQLSAGEYEVKYLTFGSEYDNNCNSTGDIGEVVDTGTMTIASDSLTTITLDRQENLEIGEPENSSETSKIPNVTPELEVMT